MNMRLDNWVWDELMEGLELRREQSAEFGETKRAEELKDLIRVLETSLGSTTVGGERVTSLTMTATIRGKRVPVELRLPE